MTNSLRGAVAFTVDGTEHFLRLTTNAQVRYEDAADEDVITALQAILSRPQRATKRLRRLFWAGLSHMGLTEDEAGDLMDTLGRAEASALIGKAVKLAFPELAAENPPQAAPASEEQTA